MPENPARQGMMIEFIRIRNYKAIKQIRWHRLEPYHVLAGPNGSGKSTFLDVIDFVRDCLRTSPLEAVERRVPNYRDLTYERKGGPITIGFRLGQSLIYNLELSESRSGGVYVSYEKLLRIGPAKILGKTKPGKDFYVRESSNYTDSFVFGLDKLALSQTPADEKRYPTGNAVKRYLTKGIKYFQLNSAAMRQPCLATRSTELELDGTNLARVVGLLISQQNRSRKRGQGPLDRWTAHLRYAIEDLKEIGWAKRESDNAEYLTLKYQNGLVCPSWLLSDGTLRMMALTLPAFLPSNGPAIYMVEEPENGVHPKALEIIIKALAAIPNAQTFVATHSPLVVQERGVKALLCFTRDENGVHITPGKDHPVLKNWNGIPDLGSIFSSRVLG